MPVKVNDSAARNVLERLQAWRNGNHKALRNIHVLRMRNKISWPLAKGAAISFPEAAFLLVSTKEARPLG